MKKQIPLFILLLTLFSLMPSCSTSEQNVPPDPPEVLEDIAYDVEPSFGYRVYLVENEEYVPYLVLTNQYNGLCLLLREYLMEEVMIYDQGRDCSAYYENSGIDCYLNESFYGLFSSSTAELIQETDIVITAEESLGYGGDVVTTIQRRVFLLSYAELNHTLFRTMLKEGDQLSYFSNADRRIAYHENGRPGSWWIRTASTAGNALACGVNPTGSVGCGGIYTIAGLSYNGVRPAFCLPCDTPIEVTSINGEECYILTENE